MGEVIQAEVGSGSPATEPQVEPDAVGEGAAAGHATGADTGQENGAVGETGLGHATGGGTVAAPTIEVGHANEVGPGAGTVGEVSVAEYGIVQTTGESQVATGVGTGADQATGADTGCCTGGATNVDIGAVWTKLPVVGADADHTTDCCCCPHMQCSWLNATIGLHALSEI